MADMEDMYSNTRYVSNVSSNLGGTRLTALYTGLGMYWGFELQWQIWRTCTQIQDMSQMSRLILVELDSLHSTQG